MLHCALTENTNPELRPNVTDATWPDLHQRPQQTQQWVVPQPFEVQPIH
jgi:hypothetical protein